MRILVVDDEQLVRWFLERALKKKGYEVIIASNANEALKILEEDAIDILMTDLRMPEANGTYLLDRVSEMAEKPRIVVCSAFITPELAEDFAERGFLTLKKPFKLDELEETLNTCVAS